MLTLLRRCFLTSLVLVGAQSRAASQTYTCLPDTADRTEALYNAVVRIVTGTDSLALQTRNAYKLPAVAGSKVSIVTTASVCQQAGAAYHAAVTDSETPPISRTLVVIKVGTTRYVVLDPREHAGEFAIQIVFDNKWKELMGF